MESFFEKKAGSWFFVVAFLIGVLSGCQAVQPVMRQTGNPAETLPDVTLGPGDVIDVKFLYNPELNDTQTVRSDGKISLLLVQEVMAYGKTPAALRSELVKLYTPELRNPEITVIVRSLFERRIYVGGEVKKPGLIQMAGRMTALEAIMEAGGFDTRTAKIGNVVIIRHKQGNRYGCKLDFSDALKGKEGQAFYLEPQDIVYVPRSTISEVNLWIDQYINKIIPRTGLSASYFRGSGTLGLDMIMSDLP